MVALARMSLRTFFADIRICVSLVFVYNCYIYIIPKQALLRRPGGVGGGLVSVGTPKSVRGTLWFSIFSRGVLRDVRSLNEKFIFF